MEAIYMVTQSGQNNGIEEVYQDLIVAVFQQAIEDCRFIIYGQNIYRHRCLSINQKKQTIEQVFRDLRRCHLLEWLVDNPEDYISMAEKKIWDEYENYVDAYY